MRTSNYSYRTVRNSVAYSSLWAWGTRYVELVEWWSIIIISTPFPLLTPLFTLPLHSEESARETTGRRAHLFITLNIQFSYKCNLMHMDKLLPLQNWDSQESVAYSLKRNLWIICLFSGDMTRKHKLFFFFLTWREHTIAASFVPPHAAQNDVPRAVTFLFFSEEEKMNCPFEWVSPSLDYVVLFRATMSWVASSSSSYFVCWYLEDGSDFVVVVVSLSWLLLQVLNRTTKRETACVCTSTAGQLIVPHTHTQRPPLIIISQAHRCATVELTVLRETGIKFLLLLLVEKSRCCCCYCSSRVCVCIYTRPR